MQFLKIVFKDIQAELAGTIEAALHYKMLNMYVLMYL